MAPHEMGGVLLQGQRAVVRLDRPARLQDAHLDEQGGRRVLILRTDGRSVRCVVGRAPPCPHVRTRVRSMSMTCWYRRRLRAYPSRNRDSPALVCPRTSAGGWPSVHQYDFSRSRRSLLNEGLGQWSAGPGRAYAQVGEDGALVEQGGVVVRDHGACNLGLLRVGVRWPAAGAVSGGPASHAARQTRRPARSATTTSAARRRSAVCDHRGRRAAIGRDSGRRPGPARDARACGRGGRRHVRRRRAQQTDVGRRYFGAHCPRLLCESGWTAHLQRVTALQRAPVGLPLPPPPTSPAVTARVVLRSCSRHATVVERFYMVLASRRLRPTCRRLADWHVWLMPLVDEMTRGASL